MEKFTTCYFILLLLTTSISADAVNDSSVDEHRVPRVSGRIVKVYSGNRPEPYMCSSEGYKSDPHNCASFYRCVQERNGKFNVFRYQCAPGTIYDPHLETCNHPRSTRRTECGGMMQPTQSVDSTLINEIEAQKELPRPIDTNELALLKEPKTTQPSVSQWVTSQSIATVKPSRTTIQKTQNSLFYAETNKYNAEYNYVMSTNQPWTSKKEEYDWTKTTFIPKDTTKNTYICSDDGFIGDTENCRKFYRCVGNQRGGFYTYEFFCSESTVWDEEIQSCNHPWAVKRSKCGRSIPFTDNSQSEKPFSTASSTEKPMQSIAEYGQKLSKTIQQQLQISHGSKVTQTQTQISHSNEVIQNQTQIHYGDRVDKNQNSEGKQNQTQISHGSAVSQTQTQIDYGNKGMQTQLQIDHSKDSSQSQTEIHESTTSQTTTTKQNSNHKNECSESGFMGDSNDCKKFYRCVNNGKGTFTKFEYICGDGTVWDQSIEACNHVWAVKECGGQSQSVPQTSTMQSSTHYADTSTTTQSISEEPEPDIDDIDVGYGNQDQTEPTTSSSTTSTKTTSHYDTTKAPQKEPNKNNECKSNGFMGDESDCKKFYRCVDNGMGGYTRHEFKCGEGTVWDSSIEACNHAWAVEKCGESGVTSESSQTSAQTTAQTGGDTTISTTMAVDKNTDEPIHITTSSTTSRSTTTEANESNVCKSSGFMGDTKNCKKFYRCVDNGDGTYTRYEFTCGEGTVWDSKIEACNHEWAVETCGSNSESITNTHSSTSQQPTLQDEDKEYEPTTTQGYNSSITTQSSFTTSTMGSEIPSRDGTCTENGFVGDKYNCKKFYRCVDNGNGEYDRYEFTCGEGTVWDASISACNHAWAVRDCGLSDTSSTQNNVEVSSEHTVSTTETDKEESSQHTTEKSTSTTTIGDTHENEVTEHCEREGFFGSLLDCKRFIRCVDDGKGSFTKYEFTCGEGTTWNQNIAACDHPSPDRPCGQDYQSTTKESQHINDEMVTETTTKMTSTSSEKDESEVTKKPQSSPGKCDSEGFNGDPSDCKKFYRCVDDGQGGYTKYDFTCGDGTVWNQEILACDHESDDKSCLSIGSRPTEATQSHSTTSVSQSESTTSSSSTTTIKQETNNTEPPPTTSSDKCTSEGFFAHPHHCKKFVRCVDNGKGEYTRYEFSCGEGTVWVQEIQACDHDNGDTKCSNQSESTTKPQDNVSSSTTESGYSSTESNESQTQNREDDEYPTTKQPTNTNSDECTSEGFFANKNDCRKFYRCVDNGEGGYTKYDFVCGEGTAWDPNIGNCNHINEVASCTENSEENSHTQQTIKDEEMSQTTESTFSTTKGTTPSSSSESNENTGSGSNTESTDNCESEGYHGDSKDCKKFYRCVDDGKGGLTKYDFTCGEGTIWDQDITNCNHPQDVTNPSCKSGDGGSEEESQTSSTSTSTSSTTSSPESTSSSSSSSSSENNTQSSSNCSQEESSKKPASSKDISCEKAGYYPNPNDCKKFYRCVDWDGDGKRFSVYHFECGEGTIWDPALDTCNHEESVYPPRDCSQTQAQTESSSGTTTSKSEEETTTQDSTTTEQSTTQESTTSEQTTTEQEKTTTQQSTTSEKTTTEQTTTSEQTTTQQSTTSEQTTTEQEQSTTSEQTTTQQSTTSEQTTTQESTTSEQTTTQKSTTSEQTTTQESTTSEQTTTQESTTSEQTTQESTTSEQTTQETTTSEQTTESSTTEQTTEKSSEQTESSTTEGTTESSTTEEEGSSTTEQSSTTEGEQQSTTESSSSSEKDCPETEDDQYLFVCPTSFKRHPKYCNMFYQCTEDDDTHEVKIATFKCPNETIYDESQTQCVEEKKADKKCNGEMARRHRFKRLNRDSKDPITVDNGKKSCPSEGYFAFEKNIECSGGFLKCEKSKHGKIRGYVHQCPEGYLFWTISKRCELVANIRDCKKSSNDWRGRWIIPVDRKNVAL